MSIVVRQGNTRSVRDDVASYFCTIICAFVAHVGHHSVAGEDHCAAGARVADLLLSDWNGKPSLI